jgi:hypothetical protein
MSSTYSPNLGIQLIGSGDQAGAWGNTTNVNLGTLIEEAISGYTTYSCTGGTDVITIPDGASGTARNMFIQLSGTGGGTVEVPAKEKLYFIYNSTASAVTVKVNGQTGVAVPSGAKQILVNNGTDVVVATNHMATLTLGAALPVASGGTGATSITAGALVKAAGTGAFTPATAAEIVGQIGSTAVTNATNATNSTNATNLVTSNFSVVQSGSKLYFKYGATNIASIDSSGNLIMLLNVTAYGTP